MIANIFYINTKKKNNKISKRIYTSNTLFDGLPLFYEPQYHYSGRNKNHNRKYKVNCNSSLVGCQNDDDCVKSCTSIRMDNDNFAVIPKCSIQHSNTCIYSYFKPGLEEKEGERDTSIKTISACLNGGQPISSFFAVSGLFSFECACPKNFIGKYCEIPNSLLPSNEKTFSLSKN